jgi:hypothetical protein
MAGIDEEWHSKHRHVVKTGAAMYDFVEFEDCLGILGCLFQF